MTQADYDAIRAKARENLATKQEPLQEFDSVDALMEAVAGEEQREAV